MDIHIYLHILKGRFAGASAFTCPTDVDGFENPAGRYSGPKTRGAISVRSADGRDA